MYLLRGGEKSPFLLRGNAGKASEEDAGDASSAGPRSHRGKLPGLKGGAPMPSLMDWQRRASRKAGHVGSLVGSPAGSRDRTRVRSADFATTSSPLPTPSPNMLLLGSVRSDASVHTLPLERSTGVLSPPRTKKTGRISPGTSNSPPSFAVPGNMNAPTFQDAGQSTLFTRRRPPPLEPTSRATEELDSSGPEAWPHGKRPSHPQQLREDDLHPRFSALRDSWQNLELFEEFASGNEDEPTLLKNLGSSNRRDLLDFAEMLDLLRSLQLLCLRGGIFNPLTQITITRVHEIFLEVNKKEWMQHVTSMGLLGEANVDQCNFEEFKLCMLCIACNLGVPLENLLPSQEELDARQPSIHAPVNRAQLIEEVKAICNRARLKSVESKPGTASFLSRIGTQDGVSEALKNVQAARDACEREEFQHARAHAQFAANVFLQNLRPDLLSEIRLVEDQISRDENAMIARKKKVQILVEGELRTANRLSKELKIDAAKAQIMKAIKMSEAARLQMMKGTLRRIFKQSEEFLAQGVRAMEGDKKLIFAWRAVQRDELKDASSALQEADELYSGIPMREGSLDACKASLQQKVDDEKDKRNRGNTLMHEAKAHIGNKRFEEAQETINRARGVFMEWTVPIGKNQQLIEHTTRLFQIVWKNEELYGTFCAFDMDNLSAVGARAMDMDFNELLQLLRALGILAERKTEEDLGPLAAAGSKKDEQKMPPSRRAQIEQRQKLVDSCTSTEIRKSDKIKIAKADVYAEFRAVNKMSQQDLVSGNMDADDDMSSLDWNEYKILIMRIAKHLDVPVTDIGCSPLFTRAIENVDELQQDLEDAKMAHVNSIVASGRRFLAGSKTFVQEKLFEEAIVNVHKAEEEFRKVVDDKVRLYEISHCRKQLETIEKERIRENHRRAEQKVLGEKALRSTEEMLQEFEELGAQFDDTKFALIEKEAIAAQKYFKSAASFSAGIKQKLVKTLSRIPADREYLLKLRQGVIHALNNISEAREMIEGPERKIASSDQSPYSKPLQLLAEAKDLFVMAKVKTEIRELVPTFEILMNSAIEGKIKKSEEASKYVQEGRRALREAAIAQGSNAAQVEILMTEAKKQLTLARHTFCIATQSDAVLEYYKNHSEIFGKRLLHEILERDYLFFEYYRDHPEIFGKRLPSPTDPGKSATQRNQNEAKDAERFPGWDLPVANGAQLCDDFEDEIEEQQKSWAIQHQEEVEKAKECIEMCKEAIEKKAFNRANESFKIARDLFKNTHAEILEATSRVLSQAEMKDRTLSKQIKGEAKAKCERARAALQNASLYLAVVTIEEALEMCLRCNDGPLLSVTEGIKKEAVSVATEKYSETVQQVQENIEQAKRANSKQRYEEAKTLIEMGQDLLQKDDFVAAIQALQVVYPFQDLPTFEDKLMELRDMTIKEERAHSAHKLFKLRQGILRLDRLEKLVQDDVLTQKKLQDVELRVQQMMSLVEHDDAACERQKNLVKKITEMVKLRQDSDSNWKGDAHQMLVQAETRKGQKRFLDAKRLVFGSHARLMEIKSNAVDYDDGRRLLLSVKLEARQMLEGQRQQFETLTRKVDHSAKDLDWPAAIEHAKASRTILQQCTDEQLILAVFDPCTEEFVSFMNWAEATARKISRFCELMETVQCISILSLPAVHGFERFEADSLTSLYPLHPVASCYNTKNLLTPLAHGVEDLVLIDNVAKTEEMVKSKVQSQMTESSDAWDVLVATAKACMEEETKINLLKQKIPVQEFSNQTFAKGNEAYTPEHSVYSTNDFEEFDEEGLQSPSPRSSAADISILEVSSSDDLIEKISAAIQSKNWDTATSILSHGAAFLSDSTNHNDSVLLKVVRNKECSVDLVCFFLDGGASVRQVDGQGRHVLHIAAQNARADVVEEVIASIKYEGEQRDESTVIEDLQFLLDTKDERGKKPLTIALESGYMPVICSLASIGISTWELDSDGLNHLHRAIQQKAYDVMPILLDTMKDVDCKTAKGLTSLMLACEQGDARFVTLLLERHADPNFSDSSGRTPLQITAHGGYDQIVNMLLNYNANPDAFGASGSSPTHDCIVQGNESCLSLMIKRGADVNLIVGGHSLLYTAAYLGKSRLVQMLIENHGDVATVDLCKGSDSGFAPLHAAIHAGHNDIVKILCAAHCAQADTQLRYASIHRIGQCLAILADNEPSMICLHEFSPNICQQESHFLAPDTSNGWNPEKLAIMFGHLKFMPMLMHQSGAVDESKHADTPKISLDVFPHVKCRQDEEPSEEASKIMNLLLSDDVTALSFSKACALMNLNLVKEYHTGEVIVSEAQYQTIAHHLEEKYSDSMVKTLEQRETSMDLLPLQSATDDHKVIELEDGAVRNGFSLPSSPGQVVKPTSTEETMARDAAGNAMNLPEDVESRLLAENKELEDMIQHAQNSVLTHTRLRAVRMRNLLKKSKVASADGADLIALQCLKEAATCFGHCGVCLDMPHSGATSSKICRVCQLSEKLYHDTQMGVWRALCLFSLNQTESHLAPAESSPMPMTFSLSKEHSPRATDLERAAKTLHQARMWIDRVLRDPQCDDTEVDTKLQKRWEELDNRYIMSAVTMETKNLVQKVLDEETLRRNKFAYNKFCRDVVGMVESISDLLTGLGQKSCNPNDINGLIERVMVMRISFLHAGNSASKHDFWAIEQSERIIHGVRQLLQAWDRASCDSVTGICVDRLSLRMARRDVIEIQGLCSEFRKDILVLQNSSPPLGASSMIKGSFEHLQTLANSFIEIGNFQVAQCEARCEAIERCITDSEATFLDATARDIMSDLLDIVEAAEADSSDTAINKHITQLENLARRQFDVSDFEGCLETIEKWNRFCQSGTISYEKIASAFDMLNMHDIVPSLRNKQVQAENILEEAGQILAIDIDKASDKLHLAKEDFEKIGDKRPHVLRRITEISQAVLGSFFKKFIEDTILPAAFTRSENASFAAAERELESSLVEATSALQQQEFALCIELCNKFRARFHLRVAELAGNFSIVGNASVLQIETLQEQASDLMKKNEFAIRTREQLNVARSIYNRTNFDEVREALALADDYCTHASLNEEDKEALVLFKEELDTDEIALVWEELVLKVQEYRDTEIRTEINDFIQVEVASLNQTLSGILNSGRFNIQAEFDHLETRITNVVNTATKRSLLLSSRPVPADSLWSSASSLARECQHLSQCAQARQSSEECLRAIEAYQNRVTKILPRRTRVVAGKRLQKARESMPTGGYSTLYTFPSNCSIRLEEVSTLLKQCDSAIDEAVEYTKQSILASSDALKAAMTHVLNGDYATCDTLLQRVASLDMVMTDEFWDRFETVQEASKTCRQRADLEVQARDHHSKALALIEQESFDAARDQAAKCSESRRILEILGLESKKLLSNLKCAEEIVVPMEIPWDLNDSDALEDDL